MDPLLLPAFRFEISQVRSSVIATGSQSRQRPGDGVVTLTFELVFDSADVCTTQAPPLDLVGTSNRPVSIKMPDMRELAAQAASRPRGRFSPLRVPRHRFTVTIEAKRDAGQITGARRLVGIHKPAHTLSDLCTADARARVGAGLHVGLASVIGTGSGLDQAIVGDAVPGKGYLLGRPALRGAATPRGADGTC